MLQNRKLHEMGCLLTQKPEAVTGTTPNTTYVDVKALAADHLTSARRRA